MRRHRGIVSESVGCCRFRIAYAGDQRYRPKGQERSGGSTRLGKSSCCREREIALDVDKAKNAQYRPHKIFWLGLENGKCKKAPRYQDGIGFLAISSIMSGDAYQPLPPTPIDEAKPVFHFFLPGDVVGAMLE